MSETKFTSETHDRLTAELADLKHGRIEIAKQIEAAPALGDLKENGDYHAAKDSQGKMEARIRQLEQMLDKAIIVDDGGSSSSAVQAGSIVGIRYDGDEEVERYFVGSIEEHRDDVAVLSPASPLGQALLGKVQGDTVEYDAPNGRLRVDVVSVA